MMRMDYTCLITDQKLVKPEQSDKKSLSTKRIKSIFIREPAELFIIF